MPAAMPEHPPLIRLERDSDTPASRQIQSGITGAIRSGVIAPGYRLPTVRELAKQLGVAAGTAAKAYKALEAAGLVTTRPRHGTRVAAPDAAASRVMTAARAYADSAQQAGLSLEDAARELERAWQQPSA